MPLFQTLSINALYSSTAAQSIPNNTSTTLVYATQSYDTFGTTAYNTTTGVYTAKVTGKYLVQASALFTSTAWPATTTSLELWKGGAVTGVLDRYIVGTAYTGQLQLAGTAQVSLNAGDTITISIFQNSGGSVALTSGAAYNQFSLTYIGK